VEEAKKLENSGCQELCIIAQDTTRYGLDLYGEYSLARLVKEICAATSIPWIRLLYCYPDKITDELIEQFKTNPRLLHYMDLPIQHINEDILKRMNRHGGSELIKQNLEKLRKEVPDMVFRTTVIVGFPGESEEQFEELCEYVKAFRFQHFGAFPYSQEEGTPASHFSGQLDEQTKQNRYDTIMAEQIPIVEAYNQARIGQEMEILIEGFDPVSETYYGRSYADAPDVDGKVYLPATEGSLSVGSFVRVRIQEALDYDLIAALL
jgi:ribosomal protein S12 methylthiotransferase